MEEEGEEVFAAGDSDGKGVSVAFDAPTQHRLAGQALTLERANADSLDDRDLVRMPVCRGP